MIDLRNWQKDALEKALKWLTVDCEDKHFYGKMTEEHLTIKN